MFEENLSQDLNSYRTQSSINSTISIDISNRTQPKPSLYRILKEDPVFPSVDFPKTSLNYEKFVLEASKLDFFPINCSENISGNYDKYVSTTLFHIAKMKNLKFSYALESPSLYENFPKEKIERISIDNKKVLLLDLDETLIHADFREEYLNNENIKYDAIITFSYENESNEIEFIDDDEPNKIEEKNSDLSNEKNLSSVGIFLRPGVEKFLEEVSKNFEVGIFTAAAPEYADAVIDYLDPQRKYIKFRLYRNNCTNVGDLLKVKDLRILKNINIKNIVLVDNNMYSFAPQLNNGILINSFYNNKDDNELDNVLRYLIDYILPADNVQKINEEFFGFKKIYEEMTNKLAVKTN